jgi:hypothetical protein
MKRASFALLLVLAACDAKPPPKTASGVRLDYVAFQETFALSQDAKTKRLEGDDLRRAIPLLDKHGVFDLAGRSFAAKDVVEQSTLVVEVKPVDQPARQIVVKSCAEEKICAFFADAAGQGLGLRRPVVCGSSSPSCGK